MIFAFLFGVAVLCFYKTQAQGVFDTASVFLPYTAGSETSSSCSAAFYVLNTASWKCEKCGFGQIVDPSSRYAYGNYYTACMCRDGFFKIENDCSGVKK
jgi:hypothetical protein